MTVERVWTIQVGNSNRSYTSIEFERKLKLESPTSFSATIKYYNNIQYFDTVTISRDDVTEWVGYIESIETKWNSDGRYLVISGRDATVILWKKYNENFSNAADKTAGFFGKVNAVELLKFMLRCPSSDTGSDTVNKSGWGLKPESMQCIASRTSKGSPDFCRLRKRGFGWRNSGKDASPAEKICDGIEQYGTWETQGSTYPYCNDPTNTNSMKSHQVDTDLTCLELTVDDLPATATSVDGLILRVYLNNDKSIWAWQKASGYISVYRASDNIWFNVIGWCFGAWTNGWHYHECDLTNIIKNRADFDDMKIRFYSTSGDMSTYVGYTAVWVNYAEEGSQETTDHFDVYFPKQKVMGVYIESRMSPLEEHPRWYRIVTKNEANNPIAGASNGWIEEPAAPNNGLVEDANGDSITFNCYPKNSEYNYYDYGSGTPLDMFERKLSFKITSSMISDKAFGIWMVASALEDRYNLLNDDENFIGCYIKNDGENLWFYAELNDPITYGHASDYYTAPLTLGTEYYVHVKKNTSSGDATILIELYGDSTYTDLLFTFSLICPFMGNVGDLRYEYIGWCYGYSYDIQNIFDNAFDEGDSDFTDWTRIKPLTDIPTKDHSNCVSGPHGCKLQVDTLYGDSWVEKEFSESDYAILDWWTRTNGPKSETFNLELRPKQYVFTVMSGWNGYVVPPYSGNTYGIREDDDDTAGIMVGNEASYMNSEMSIWTFDPLLSKYQAIKIPNTASCSLTVEGRLYDGVDGHATSMTVSVMIYRKSTNEWIAKDFTFTSTSWAEKNAEITKWGAQYLQTVNDVNNVLIRILYTGCVGGGVGKGGLMITSAWIKINGTAYWGDTRVAKIFNKEVSGTSNPNGYGAIAMVGLRVNDEVDHPELYHVYIMWWDDSGFHSDYSADYHLTTNVWKHFWLWTKVNDGEGYVGLFSSTLGVLQDIEIYNKDFLTNISYGNPDCFTLCNDCSFEGMMGTIIWVDSVGLDGLNTNAHTVGVISSQDETFTELIAEEDNSGATYYRDLIHSWVPVETDNLRIEITRQTTGIAWSVSQIYVYKTTDDRFRIFLESGETDRFNMIPYAGGPFIKAMSFDSIYPTQMFPMNIPQGRLIDTINLIVNHCVDANNVPYEWWLAQDVENTFHFKDQKGSDLSASVTFDKGVKLGASTRSQSVGETVQRIYVVGRGEGKTKENVSKWVEPTSTTDNMDTIRTFYEDILSDTKQINNESEADLIGKVKLEEDSEPKEQIIIKISKDSYEAMEYDVGDIVTITDILTGISGTYEIYNISVTIDSNGEQPTLVVGEPDESVNNELTELYRRMKQLEIGDIIIADWTAEGSQATKISQSKITAKFEKTAKNEEQDAPSDVKDPSWSVIPTPSYHENDHPPYVVFEHGMQFLNADDYMELLGNNDDAVNYHGLKVAITGALASDITDYKAILLRRNPKLVIDFKLMEPNTPNWQNGDSFRVGFNDNTTSFTGGSTLNKLGKGYYLWIQKVSGFFYCWLVYSDNTYEYYESGQVVDTINPKTDLSIRKLDSNIKYRLELTIERSKNANGTYTMGMAIAKITKLKSPNDPAGTISEEDTPDLAPTGIISINNLNDFTVVPLWMLIYSKYGTNKLAQVFLYKYSSEWETVDNDAESGY